MTWLLMALAFLLGLMVGVIVLTIYLLRSVVDEL